MSDREIMEAKGLGVKKSIHNPELYNQTSGKKVKFDTEFTTYMPNQKWHRYISFIKSGVRILGYGLLIINVPVAVGVLIFSEIIGIIEELV